MGIINYSMRLFAVLLASASALNVSPDGASLSQEDFEGIAPAGQPSWKCHTSTKITTPRGISADIFGKCLIRQGYDEATREAINAYATTAKSSNARWNLVKQFTNPIDSKQYDWPTFRLGQPLLYHSNVGLRFGARLQAMC